MYTTKTKIAYKMFKLFKTSVTQDINYSCNTYERTKGCIDKHCRHK